MIQIENLTAYQCEMLDIMWELDSEDEYIEWFKLLDPEDQLLAESLQCLIIFESLEPTVQEMDNYWLANNYLKKFQLR
jgi:hypothetical protein